MFPLKLKHKHSGCTWMVSPGLNKSYKFSDGHGTFVGNMSHFVINTVSADSLVQLTVEAPIYLWWQGRFQYTYKYILIFIYIYIMYVQPLHIYIHTSSELPFNLVMKINTILCFRNFAMLRYHMFEYNTVPNWRLISLCWIWFESIPIVSNNYFRAILASGSKMLTRS